jgi:hypothetical protein
MEEIKTHIARNGGQYKKWYVGIAKSARDLLLDRHKTKGDLYIYRQAYSSYIAAEVQDHFVDTYGTDGNIDSRDSAGDTIYVYRKTTGDSDRSRP